MEPWIYTVTGSHNKRDIYKLNIRFRRNPGCSVPGFFIYNSYLMYIKIKEEIIMAKFHQNLQYHKDEVQKKELTIEDLQFLCNLQKEINTQDTVGQADPRFWVIKGSEIVINDDGYDISLINDEGCMLAMGGNDIAEYINDALIDYLDIYKVEYGLTNEFVIYNNKEEYDNKNGDYNDANSLNSELLRDLDYRIVYYDTKDIIYPNTFFLTQKDAEKHLRENYYHYSEDAHTYAMTAWRSPICEKLWNILHEIDFEKMKEDLEQKTEA